MPKTITSKQERTNIVIPHYECKADKTRVYRPLFDYENQQTTNKPSEKLPKFVRRQTQSSNPRCNRAVKLAEKEWNPNKIYETAGKNRGPDIVRYRYGEDNDFAWCATFFNYIYNPNHIAGQNVLGMSDKDVKSTQKILKRAKEVGCFADAKSGYKPQVGDAILWRSDSDNMKGHIGIVTEVREDGSFVTIQGNNNDKVEKIEYSSVQDAMRRISSSGASQTLQGFVQMSKYNSEHSLAQNEIEDSSVMNPDSDYCWLS